MAEARPGVGRLEKRSEMTFNPSTTIPHVVVVGGGFGGLETILYLRDRLKSDVRITLVSASSRFVFRPYLTYLPFGLVAERLEVELEAFAAAHSVTFIRGRVASNGPGAHALLVDGSPLSYDHLVIATGACYERSNLPGLSEHALMVGDSADLLVLRDTLQDLLEYPAREGIRDVVLLVPSALHWPGPLYEMAFMIETWLRWKGLRQRMHLTVVTSEDSYMEELGPEAHGVLAHEFSLRSIAALNSRRVHHVDPHRLVFVDGSELRYDLLLTSPACQGSTLWSRWPVDANGFLKVDPASRQIQGTPDAFAVGDAADHPVKQAFLALLQADAAGEHLAARILGVEPRFGFRPSGFWILEQLDQALLFQPPPHDETGRSQMVHVLSVGDNRRLDLGQVLSRHYDTSNPLYAGLLWKGAKSGLRVLPFLTRQGSLPKREMAAGRGGTLSSP